MGSTPITAPMLTTACPAIHATAAAEDVAAQHATDLQTGSRSTLTATVGLVSTALLGAILVWLALRTRRIINVPLLVATAITGWLTYVSLNPGALPLDIDQRVDTAGAASQALQDVRLARAAQYGQVLGAADSRDAVEQATRSVTGVGERSISDDWRVVFEGPPADLVVARSTLTGEHFAAYVGT